MGPMGKSVRDAKLMYNIVAHNKTTEQTLSDMTIQFLPDQQPYPLSDKTKEILLAIRAFLRTSFSIEQDIPPYFTDSADIWQEIMSIEGGKSVKEHAFGNKGGNVVSAYIKERLTSRTPIHKYLSWALIGATLFRPSKNRINQINQIIEDGDIHLADHLSKRILILPVYHSGAPLHGELYKEIFSIRKTFRKYLPYITYANVWGLPSLTVPVGVDENDMPIGIQIISKNGNEGEIFALGERLEKQFRGYVRCKDFDSSA